MSITEDGINNHLTQTNNGLEEHPNPSHSKKKKMISYKHHQLSVEDRFNKTGKPDISFYAIN